MRRKPFLALLLALALVGCSDDSTATKDSGSPKKDGKVQDQGKKPDSKKINPDTAPTKYAQVCGIIEDPAGAKLTNHPVIVCIDAVGCFSGNSTSTGDVCVGVDTASDYVTHATATTTGGKNYLDLYFPVIVTQAHINGEKKVQAGKMVVPPTAAPFKMVDIKKGGNYDLGGGVSLVIPAGATKKPPLISDVKLGAAALKKEKVNTHSNLYYKGSGKLHMAVAFGPIETTFTSPVSFKFPAHGLATGASVEVYFMNEKDGKMVKEADAKESGGSIVNVTGQGIKHLGMMLVYTK